MSEVDKQDVLARALDRLPWAGGIGRDRLLSELRGDPPLRDLVRLYAGERIYHGVDEVLEEIPAASFRYVAGEERRLAEVIGRASMDEQPEDRVIEHQAGRSAGDEQPWGTETTGSVPDQETVGAGVGGASFAGTPAGDGGEATGTSPSRGGGTENAEADTSGLTPPEGTPGAQGQGDRPRGPGAFTEGAEPPPVYDL